MTKKKAKVEVAEVTEVIEEVKVPKVKAVKAVKALETLETLEAKVVESTAYALPEGTVVESVTRDGDYISYSLLDGTSYKKHLSELPTK